MASYDSLPRISTGVWRLIWVFAALCGTALTAGLLLEPSRTWINLFLISNFVIGLGLGGLLFGALLDVTGARWSRSIRPVADAMAGTLPLGAIGVAAVLLFRPSMYSWAMEAVTGNTESPLHQLWLSRPFFLLRSGLYLAIWIFFAVSAVRNLGRSREHDVTNRSKRRSALFLVLFGITCWLASTDWIMSLEPEWTSTAFSVYYFAGVLLSGLAALVLIMICLRHFGPRSQAITDDQLQDLGTLMFGFSCFWMYIWFCQYMLIWYVNISEETLYFRKRLGEPWLEWTILVLACNWGLPFLLLLFRAAKRIPTVIGAVAAVILIGRWVDLSVMIIPSQHDMQPALSIIGASQIIGAVGLCFAIVFAILGRYYLNGSNASAPNNVVSER